MTEFFLLCSLSIRLNTEVFICGMTPEPRVVCWVFVTGEDSFDTVDATIGKYILKKFP